MRESSARRVYGPAVTLKRTSRGDLSLPAETFDVFFSYNSQDREAVRKVHDELKARGVDVWRDQGEIDYGDAWQDKLQEIIAEAPAALIFLGPHGLGRWQKPEINACHAEHIERQMVVVPALLTGMDEAKTPLFLKGLHRLDLRSGISPEDLDHLVRTLCPKKTLLPPISDSRLPRRHNIPFLPLGDRLKGRDEELEHLIANLQGPASATALTQAIHGLGGIGKTRLAAEYALQSGDRYDFALFVVADSPEALRSGLAGLARPGLLNLPEFRAGAEAETVEAVLTWLQGHFRWLLILDNVDTEESAAAVKKILPQIQNGHVLITSRRRDWPATIKKQPLDELTREESTQFLLQRTEEERSLAGDDAIQADRLAEILGGLPLALEQAAAYIAHYQISLATYIEEWEKERSRVLEWHSDDMGYPSSVAATWQTTFSRLTPKAAALLRLTAFLAPEPIPEAMFEKGEAILEEGTEALLTETGQSATEQTVRDALVDLAAYSMVARRDGNLTVHRVVQEVVAGRIPEDRRRDWIEWSLRLVNGYSPPTPSDVRTWPIWDLLRPHARRTVELADDEEISKPTARLMNQLAVLLSAKSLYAEAEPLKRRVLKIDEESFGTLHPNVAIDLNNLALLLQDTNRLQEAEPLMRRALKIDEESFGTLHPNVARDLNNLATLLQDTNRLQEAEPLMRRALQIDEESFGPQHPNVAIRLNNLAQLLQATNRLQEAEPLMRRALKIGEDSLGPEHPNVAIRLNNLATLLQATNRLQEAEPLMRRAVGIYESSLGPDHPRTQNARRNLEILLAEMAPEGPAESGS